MTKYRVVTTSLTWGQESGLEYESAKRRMLELLNADVWTARMERVEEPKPKPKPKSGGKK